jgi:predicted transcriptional regulator
MTTIQLTLPDDITRLIDSFAKSKEVFVLEAVEEKIKREKGKINLLEKGITEAKALAQRHAFATFAEDWESPEMDVYDKL